MRNSRHLKKKKKAKKIRVYVALIFGFFKSIGRITHSDMLFAVMDLFGWLIKVK